MIIKRMTEAAETGIRLIILAIFLVSYNACAPSGSNMPDGTAGTIVPTGSAPASNISLIASPSTIMTTATSSIQATVTTSTGAYVADGTSVTFELSSTALGTITSSATTSNGIATATFTAGTIPGTVTVTATSGSVSQTTAIVISAPSAGNLEYVSATPQVIGLKGGGQTASSAVIFLVKDINGTPVVDGTRVDFVMSGPSGGKLPADGGEYIGDIDDSPATAFASTVDGYATVTLNSGSVAGPVTIEASVTTDSQTFSASSAVISIGGGIPSATHLDVVVEAGKQNLPGLSNLVGVEAIISAYIADRFGNFNVLDGTSVSFYAEGGAIDRQGVADATGVTSVVFRTQSPMPQDITKADAGSSVSTAYFQGVAEPWYTSGTRTYNPRDGWVTVLATVQGEEAFNDANGNGLYDTGEAFTDLGEPFYDKNDDGCYNTGTTKNCNGTVSASTDPFEEYIDADGDGSYDFPNGVWDGPNCPGAGCQTSKMIWDDLRLVFSDNFYYYWPSPDPNNCYNTNTENPTCNATLDSACFAVASSTITKGGSGSFTAIIGDINLNTLPEGTNIKASSSVGTVFPDSTDLIDGLSRGPSWFSFSVDVNADEEKNSATVGITVTDTDANASSCYITVPLGGVPLDIITTDLASGTTGTAYSFTLTAVGGTTPYTWSSTALPAGLSFSASSGAISGTPTAAGIYNITFTLYDSIGASTSKPLSLTIN